MLGSVCVCLSEVFLFGSRNTCNEKLCIEMEIFVQAGGKMFPTF